MNSIPDHSVYIAGQPGTGKSYHAAREFNNTKPQGYKIIFVNTTWRNYFTTHIYYSIQEIINQLQESNKFVWNPERLEDLTHLVDYLEEIHKSAIKNNLEVPKIKIYVDEIDLFARTHSKFTAAEKIFTKLRNFNIYGVGIAQRITGQTNKNIVACSQEFIIFRLYADDYLNAQRQFNLPENPQIFEYYRIYLGRLYKGDKNGNEQIYGAKPEEEPTPEPPRDQEPPESSPQVSNGDVPEERIQSS